MHTPAETHQDPHLYNIEFRGNALEYWSIWIVNTLLTIITLGLYYPWAKVRNQRYFYGNTYIGDDNLDYLASPMQILIGRLIALAAFAIYYVVSSFYALWGLALALLLMVLGPWAIVRSLNFNARNSVLRSIRFGFEASYKQTGWVIYVLPLLCVTGLALLIFVPGYLLSDIDLAAALEYFKQAESEAQPLPPEFASLIASMSLFYIGFLLLIPYFNYRFTKFFIANHKYGTHAFRFDTSAKPYYLLAGRCLLLAVILAVFAVLGNLFLIALAPSLAVLVPVLGVISMLAVVMYWNAGIVNIQFNHAHLGDEVHFHAQVSPARFGWISISNMLLILLSLGLLIPWAKVRMARYLASVITLECESGLNNFIADESKKVSALGEQVGEVFDLDVGGLV